MCRRRWPPGSRAVRFPLPCMPRTGRRRRRSRSAATRRSPSWRSRWPNATIRSSPGANLPCAASSSSLRPIAWRSPRSRSTASTRCSASMKTVPPTSDCSSAQGLRTKRPMRGPKAERRTTGHPMTRGSLGMRRRRTAPTMPVPRSCSASAVSSSTIRRCCSTTGRSGRRSRCRSKICPARSPGYLRLRTRGSRRSSPAASAGTAAPTSAVTSLPSSQRTICRRTCRSATWR